MRDGACVPFLKRVLPRLGLRWAGFRKVRGQVCKRIGRRFRALELPDLAAYEARLRDDPAEWDVLRGLCIVTISRFYRGRGTWDALRGEVLPALARDAREAGEDALWCWSLGCASGEEPYTLSLAWELDVGRRFPGLKLRVLATDVDPTVLERAREGVYEPGSLRDLPPDWREAGFEAVEGGRLRLRDRFRQPVELRRQGVREALPEHRFRLVLCRYLVFTYFDEAVQRQLLEGILDRMAPGAALVVGAHEAPPPCAALEDWLPSRGIFRRR